MVRIAETGIAASDTAAEQRGGIPHMPKVEIALTLKQFFVRISSSRAKATL
jgi:hypothetical protein